MIGDRKFCSAFQATIDVAGVKRVVLPARSQPNLNAYALAMGTLGAGRNVSHG